MTPPPVRCRDLQATDEEAVVRLLDRGFPPRGVAYWRTGIGRLMDRAGELGTRPGVVLESGADLVGVLLLVPGGGSEAPRLNLSSWFVEPRFSAYGPLLANQATKRRDVTFVNVSPAPHTVPVIEAQGFQRYSQGRILALPALMGHRSGVRVRRFQPDAHAALPETERALLARHVGYGCLALVAEAEGALVPFLFLPWRVKRLLPGAQLVYCRDIADLVRFGGGVGRHLLRRGMAVVVVDTCGPADGLPGSRIADRSPKYAKGPTRPRTGDLSDTEIVMFGP